MLLAAVGILMVMFLFAMFMPAVKTGESNRNAHAVASHQNSPSGTVKHLHVISAYSGQVIIHSAVRGDVGISERGIGAARTPKDLKWCDTNGVAHELYVSDRTVIHISSEPLALRGDISHENAGPKLEAEK